MLEIFRFTAFILSVLFKLLEILHQTEGKQRSRTGFENIGAHLIFLQNLGETKAFTTVYTREKSKICSNFDGLFDPLKIGIFWKFKNRLLPWMLNFDNVKKNPPFLGPKYPFLQKDWVKSWYFWLTCQFCAYTWAKERSLKPWWGQLFTFFLLDNSFLMLGECFLKRNHPSTPIKRVPN